MKKFKSIENDTKLMCHHDVEVIGIGCRFHESQELANLCSDDDFASGDVRNDGAQSLLGNHEMNESSGILSDKHIDHIGLYSPQNNNGVCSNPAV